MELRIDSEEDYQAALSRVEELMDLDPEFESVEGEELERLAIIIEAYEAQQGWGF